MTNLENLANKKVMVNKFAYKVLKCDKTSMLLEHLDHQAPAPPTILIEIDNDDKHEPSKMIHH